MPHDIIHKMACAGVNEILILIHNHKFYITNIEAPLTHTMILRYIYILTIYLHKVQINAGHLSGRNHNALRSVAHSDRKDIPGGNRLNPLPDTGDSAVTVSSDHTTPWGPINPINYQDRKLNTIQGNNHTETRASKTQCVYCSISRYNTTTLDKVKRRILEIKHLVNPLNPDLNPICYLLVLLAHHFLHVSSIRVKSLTIRLLMSYIYIYI
jgi:hypothetical protein